MRGKEMKKRNVFCLILCIVLLLGMALLPSFADEPAESSPAGETTSAEEEKSAFSEPTGILGFFNGVLQLTEGGGLVTRIFGTEMKATVNGEEAVARNYEPVSYWLTYVLVAVLAYVLGSINFGIVFADIKFERNTCITHSS